MMVAIGFDSMGSHAPLTAMERVARGESLTITRHGRPVARLVPVEDDDRSRALRASRRILERRTRLARLSLSELLGTIHEGRRF